MKVLKLSIDYYQCDGQVWSTVLVRSDSPHVYCFYCG